MTRDCLFWHSSIDSGTKQSYYHFFKGTEFGINTFQSVWTSITNKHKHKRKQQTTNINTINTNKQLKQNRPPKHQCPLTNLFTYNIAIKHLQKQINLVRKRKMSRDHETLFCDFLNNHSHEAANRTVKGTPVRYVEGKS